MSVQPTNLHRVYIQTLLARRIMTMNVALEMYKRAVSAVKADDVDFEPRHGTDERGFIEFINEVSTVLNGLGMAVKFGADEATGQKMVILRNEADDVALQATDLTPLQISYFRAVIEAIVKEYPGYSIGAVAAYSLTSTLVSKMTPSEANDLLQVLVARHWLVKSERGRYSLGTRALVELDAYLRETYSDDMLTCGRCSHFVTIGTRCGNDDCNWAYHKYCFDKHLRGMQGTCMKCNTPFANSNPTPVGEAAVPRHEDNNQSVPRFKRKRPTMNGTQTQEETQTQRRSSRTANGAANGAANGHANGRVNGFGQANAEAGPSRPRGARYEAEEEDELESTDEVDLPDLESEEEAGRSAGPSLSQRGSSRRPSRVPETILGSSMPNGRESTEDLRDGSLPPAQLRTRARMRASQTPLFMPQDSPASVRPTRSSMRIQQETIIPDSMPDEDEEEEEVVRRAPRRRRL